MTSSPRLKAGEPRGAIPGVSCFTDGCLPAFDAGGSYAISTGMNPQPQPADWFDAPNSTPRRRKSMEQAVAALAARTGRPTWPVIPTLPSGGGRDTANGKEQS